jgi:hypothetical protein
MSRASFSLEFAERPRQNLQRPDHPFVDTRTQRGCAPLRRGAGLARRASARNWGGTATSGPNLRQYRLRRRRRLLPVVILNWQRGQCALRETHVNAIVRAQRHAAPSDGALHQVHLDAVARRIAWHSRNRSAKAHHPPCIFRHCIRVLARSKPRWGGRRPHADHAAEYRRLDGRLRQDHHNLEGRYRFIGQRPRWFDGRLWQHDLNLKDWRHIIRRARQRPRRCGHRRLGGDDLQKSTPPTRASRRRRFDRRLKHWLATDFDRRFFRCAIDYDRQLTQHDRRDQARAGCRQQERQPKPMQPCRPHVWSAQVPPRREERSCPRILSEEPPGISLAFGHVKAVSPEL